MMMLDRHSLIDKEPSSILYSSNVENLNLVSVILDIVSQHPWHVVVRVRMLVILLRRRHRQWHHSWHVENSVGRSLEPIISLPESLPVIEIIAIAAYSLLLVLAAAPRNGRQAVAVILHSVVRLHLGLLGRDEVGILSVLRPPSRHQRPGSVVVVPRTMSRLEICLRSRLAIVILLGRRSQVVA